jgi:hypothetical protein
MSNQRDADAGACAHPERISASSRPLCEPASALQRCIAEDAMENKASDERRDPEELAKRGEQNREADRGRGDPETVPVEPREDAPHGTVKEEPQRKSGPYVGYPAR